MTKPSAAPERVRERVQRKRRRDLWYRPFYRLLEVIERNRDLWEMATGEICQSLWTPQQLALDAYLADRSGKSGKAAKELPTGNQGHPGRVLGRVSRGLRA